MSAMPPVQPFHTLRVGAAYIPGRTRLPEAVLYNYRAGHHELLMWLGGLSGREIVAVQRGPVSLALAVHPPVLFLLCRFGDGIPWPDAPFSLWTVPEFERTLPEPTQLAEPHALLSAVLVAADTGLVRALRMVSLSRAFTAALHLAIRDQHAAGWPGQAAYDRALDALYRRYPTSDQLLETAIARTEGGR